MYKFYDFIVDNIAYKFTDSSNTSVETARKEYYYELENIVFPSSVTYGGMAHQVVAIGDFTLHNSAKVKTVTIPSSVRRIGCHALSYLPELETISLPSSCETVGEGAFFGCEKLSSVNLGYVTYIGLYAFYSCKKLSSVSFSNNLVELGNYSFACCRMLSSITIPQHCHLTSGGGTFLGVDLSSVACNVVSPQKIPDSTFSERTYYYVDLRVPSESTAAYRHTPHWTLFRSINGSAPQLYYVTAEPTSFSNIASSGGSNLITVMSNTSWTANVNQSWCTLSATSGSNNSTVNFTVGTNSLQSGRSAIITFRISTGSTATVSLSQAGQSSPAHTLSVSPTSVTKDSLAANNITLTVTSDTSWTVHSYETWCVIDTPASGSGTGNGTITFHITQNGGSERQCTINVSGTDASSVSITVKQQAQGGLPTIEQFWYSDNYIVDIAVDDYMCHNYNFGQHTHGTSDGWENQSDTKREYLCNVAVIPNFSDDYVYGTKYAKWDPQTGYLQVTKSGITFYRYEFSNITASEYTGPANNTYRLRGPFYDVPFSSYIEEVQRIGDFPGRNPNFNLNYGRVRPLGGVDTANRVPNDPGNIWNSIYNATMVVIITGDNSHYDDTDLNGDGPTSYPSGHAAQTWSVAMLLLQAYHDNITKGLQYVKDAYSIGVARTVGRFHWNSDTMYGRVSATMIMPIINSIQLTESNYNSFCTSLHVSVPSASLPIATDYSEEFTLMLDHFNNIVSINDTVKKYLWSMYKAGKDELDNNTHGFLSQTTYPEIFPIAGHTVTINGTSRNVKLRGSNTTYNVNGINRNQIMMSWLMAMALSEIFLSQDTNTYQLGTPPSENLQNVQTKLFAKAYEVGGGRAVNFYNEYKIDYDPTILRLAAAMVYAIERGKYSYATIHGMPGATNPDLLNGVNSYSDIGCSADRNTRIYTVGWGVNSYYIFPDGPGPHRNGTYTSGSATYKYYRNCFNPYDRKNVGSTLLQQQVQDESQFCIGQAPGPGPIEDDIVFTLTIINNFSQEAKLNGEMYFYMERTTHDDYDNTGKGANDNPPGILLDGYSSGMNTISIPAGGQKSFTVTIKKEMLYRHNLWLSNKAASQSLLISQGQSKSNVIFYSRGRWDYGSGGPAHISGAYDTGFVDDNLNGVELVSGSTHTVKISSSQPSITSGEIIITDT